LDFGVWTKHGERGVVMEDDEEEEDVNNILDWTAGQAFANTTVRDANEEELIEDSGLQMILVRCYEMHRETAKKRNNW
jgi:hypothetical protein